jgi:hypothetical protein
MTPQATLTSFTAQQSTLQQPEAPPSSFGCSTCVCNLGISVIAGHEKVHCRGQGSREVRQDACSGWWDGRDLAESWPKVPDNMRPRPDRLNRSNR